MKNLSYRRVNESKILQRRKQIDYGKNTMGYERYIKLVPRNERRKSDPQTPNVYSAASKRAFDGIVKKWRRALHKYDQVFSFQVPKDTQNDRICRKLSIFTSIRSRDEEYKDQKNFKHYQGVRRFGKNKHWCNKEKWETNKISQVRLI